MSEIKALHEQCKLINATAGLGVVSTTFTTVDTATLAIRTRGPANTGMWVDWGDGSSEWIEHIGTGSDVNTSHAYGGAPGFKLLTFSGNLSAVTYFRSTDTLFGGDIANLDVFTGATYFNFYLTAVVGDISVFNGFTLPSTIGLADTDVSGNISNLSAIVSLTALDLWRTSITGDIISLIALTSLTYLNAHDTALSGDVGDLSTLTSLTTLNLETTSVTYGTTTLPAWSNCTISLQDNAWSVAEVDNFLIDLDAAGGTNGTLNIAGTNSAHSAASNAALANLIANGWAVTVN
jgi:hypothetical protein